MKPKYYIALLLAVSILTFTSPNFAQVRSSEDFGQSFRVTNITTVELDHPKTKEHGLGIGIAGVIYGMAGKTALICFWSGGEYVAYPFAVYCETNEYRFKAVPFLPDRLAPKLDPENSEIHMRSADGKALIDTFTISSDRYRRSERYN